MRLIAREPTLEDFDDYYHICFERDRGNCVLREVVAHEWRAFLMHPAALSCVIEDVDREPGGRLVCCAQAVFVTDKFVEWAKSAVGPWMIRTAANSLPDGSSPLCSAAEVEEGCTERGRLNSLVTRWAHGNTWMSEEYRQCVHEFRQRTFFNMTRGYRFGQILCESVGAMAVKQAQGAGFGLWTDYDEYYRANPPAPPDERRPYLSGITREEAVEVAGSLMSHFFAYQPRRFGFTADEREVVHYAMMGCTETATADATDNSVNRIKYLWGVLYDKVDAIDPALFASLRGDKAPTNRRGAEKRRLLLAYLRDHPEELRVPRV